MPRAEDVLSDPSMAFALNALVVDDDDHVRTFLIVLLRKVVSGTVFEARNGVEALEITEQKRPGLILLDVNMPTMDGLEALRRIRQTQPDVPIIMITSLATRKVVEDALASGASNFVRKDTPKAEIIEIIRETILFSLPEGIIARDDTGGSAP
jgi:two-component system chemotaxis response regulator CheY